MEKNESIAAFIEGIENLPTLPGIAMRILEEVQKDDPNVNELSQILSTDPPLSAKILKLVNSSFYNRPSRIMSVHHAINMLGIAMVKNLALSFSLVNDYKNKKSKGFDYACFWKNSLIGAVSSELITQRLDTKLLENAFFMGLLQDIGTLTLGHCMSKQYDQLLLEMDHTTPCIYVAENRIFGHNHQEIGEYLMKSWGLPESMCIPIGFHHNPENLESNQSEIQILTRILHLSSLFIELFNSDSKGLILYLLKHKIKSYGFTDCIDVDLIAEETHQKTRQVFPIFEIQLNRDEEYAQILQIAKMELSKISTGMISNLLEQRNEIQMLKQQVARDSMTDLYNHNHFMETLKREMSRAERYNNPLSLIMADIDKFKAINDTFGHIVGDRAIKAVAGCLKTELRESDRIARYGGDEFAIILPETEINEALRVAERIRQSVDGLRIKYDDNFLNLTMSFGIFSYGLDEKITPDESIRRADVALYQAKKRGRNQCCMFFKERESVRKR
jgi:diguanylate cyclase (GGDEF)-like protein